MKITTYFCDEHHERSHEENWVKTAYDNKECKLITNNHELLCDYNGCFKPAKWIVTVKRIKSFSTQLE